MAGTSLLPALALLLLLAMALASSSDAQPSPGYYPSWRFRPVVFNRGYSNKWGPQHQTVSGDHSALTIWLDRTCVGSSRSMRTGTATSPPALSSPPATPPAPTRLSTCLTTRRILVSTTRSTWSSWAPSLASPTRCRPTCTSVAAATGGSSGGRCASTSGSTPPRTSTTTPSSGTRTPSPSSWTTCPSVATSARRSSPSRTGPCGPTAPSGTPPTGPPTTAGTGPTTATSPSSRASTASSSPGAGRPRRRRAARSGRPPPARGSRRSSTRRCGGRSSATWSTTTARTCGGTAPSRPSAELLIDSAGSPVNERWWLLHASSAPHHPL